MDGLCLASLPYYLGNGINIKLIVITSRIRITGLTEHFLSGRQSERHHEYNYETKKTIFWGRCLRRDVIL